MPKQNAEIFEVLLRQIADDREVNAVVGEPLGVLTQANRLLATRQCLSWHFSSICGPLLRPRPNRPSGRPATSRDGHRSLKSAREGQQRKLGTTKIALNYH
jgi:hypothetical protein